MSKTNGAKRSHPRLLSVLHSLNVIIIYAFGTINWEIKMPCVTPNTPMNTAARDRRSSNTSYVPFTCNCGIHQ